MEQKLFIPIILGTAREGRESENAAKFMLAAANIAGIETELLDVRDYLLQATDNSEDSEITKRLAGKVSRADGLIIVSPEYNHGYPGELKMMLDMLYEQYARKPIGICGVSAGAKGGARAVEQLRLVAIELHMVPIYEAVYFSQIGSLFNEAGEIQDSSYKASVAAFLEELIWYARVLKKGRGGEKKE